MKTNVKSNRPTCGFAPAHPHLVMGECLQENPFSTEKSSTGTTSIVAKFAIKYTLFCMVTLAALYALRPDVFAVAFPIISDPIGFFKGYKYLRLVAAFGSLGLGLGIECLVVGWEQCSAKRILTPTPSAWRDFVTCMAALSGIFNIIGYVATLGLSYFLGTFLADHVGINFRFIAEVPTDFGKAMVTVVTIGFFEYWAHRAFHRIPRLWALHKYHHSSTDMTVFAAHRDNPFSGIIMGLMTTIPFSFFGATLASFFWIGIMRGILDYLIHSQIKHNWGWVGRWVLTSPSAHRLHHSAEPKHFDQNYGFFLIFWDRIFGTYNPDENVTSFGTDDPIYNRGPFLDEMIAGFSRALLNVPDPKEAPERIAHIDDKAA